MYIVVLLALARGCWLYVECGSSASGHRRSLRLDVCGYLVVGLSNSDSITTEEKGSAEMVSKK
jgi:hypothetical protein